MCAGMLRERFRENGWRRYLRCDPVVSAHNQNRMRCVAYPASQSAWTADVSETPVAGRPDFSRGRVRRR